MILTVTQNKFLANDANNKRLIEMLKIKFEAANFGQTSYDITLIINTAILVSSTFDSVIVVGEDENLLTLVTALSTRLNIGIYAETKKRKNFAKNTINKKHIGKTAADHGLFLHAFSGCDTTSVLFNQDLNEVIQVFKNPNADPGIIATAGVRFLL